MPEVSPTPARPTWWSVLRRLLRSASEHRVAPMAGEAAFFAALAVFPALLTVVAAVRALGDVLGPGADRATVSGLTAVLRVVLTTRGSAATDAATELLASARGGVLTVGTLAALFLLARALRSVLYAITLICGAPARRLWPASAALAVVTLFAAVAIIALAVTDPLRLLAVPGAEAVWSVLRWPVGVAALAGWAMLLLRVGSGRRAGGSRALGLAALIATGGWIAASLLLPLYVSVVARLTGTVGALGGGLILLLWLYLLMLVLYAAAEVRCLLAAGRARGRPE